MQARRPVVAFVSHRNQLEHFGRTSSHLKRLGYDAELWTVDARDADIARSGHDFARVIDLTVGFARWHARDPQRRDEAQRVIRQFEQRAGGPFLHQDAAIDRSMTGFGDAAVDHSRVRERWSLTEAACLTAHLISASEELVAREELVAIVGETNTLPYRVLHRVAKLSGVPHLNPSFVSHSDGRTVYERSLTAGWDSCLALYEKYLSMGVPPDQRTWAAEKRESIVHGEKQDPFVATMRRGSPRVWQRWAVEGVRRSLREWKHARTEASRNSPRGVYPELVSPSGKLRRALQAEVRGRYYEMVAHRGVPDRRYACYFLHVQPESTVDCLAFEYMDQIATIRNIAATLPGDMLLAVKEHRVDAGRRTVEFYSELSAIPGVALVHDAVNSIAIIKSAEIVFSLTGTVSLEAACCGVPAVVFGEVYYEGFEGITRVRSYADLRGRVFPQITLEAATPEQAIAALAARRAASHEGDLPWLDAGNPQLPALMAASLVRECER